MSQDRAAKLHRDAAVVDCHNDLVMLLARQDHLGDRGTLKHRWIPELRAGGVDVQVIPVAAESPNPEASLRQTLQSIAAWYREVESNQDDVAACGTGEEIDRALAEGKIAMILALEGASSFGREPSLVPLFYRLGVRMVSFTHMGRSWLADGSGEDGTGGRLTRAGVGVLTEMERLGMVIDISHVGAASTDHILDLATRPVVASHSSARALRDHHRNLSDAQLRRVAANRGVVGVNFLPAFTDPAEPTIGKVVDHIEHVMQVAGPEHVGMGPDFVTDIFDDIYPAHVPLVVEGVDARQKVPGLFGARHLPVVTEELLRRGHSDDVVLDILGRNFLRVFNQVMGVPGAARDLARVAFL